MFMLFFFFKQKTAYEMRISDWSSDVCSSDLVWQAASIAVNARPISLNMSFISALALNLDINAAIRRQACDQIVAVLLIALHRRPAFTVTLRPYCRRRYALRNQRIDRKSTRLNSSH